MLSRLYISNYAIIDELDISFDKGLNIITGETGAGKSILLGATGLILGGRSDKSVMQNKDQKCVLRAEFSNVPNSLRSLFDNFDIDYDEHTIILREISPSGRSRVYINERPSTVKVAAEIGAALIDMHRQHDSLDILENTHQLLILDAHADQLDTLNKYQEKYKALLSTQKQLNELSLQADERAKESDYLQFQIQELEQTEIIAGELKNLEEQLSLAQNQEKIRSVAQSLNAILDGEGSGVLDLLRGPYSELNKMRGSSKSLDQSTDELGNLIEQLESFNMQMSDWSDGDQSGNVDLEELTDRIDLINRLMVKHRVQEDNALIETLHALRDKLDQLEADDSVLNALKEQQKKLLSACNKLAKQLNKGRIKAVPTLEKESMKILSDLSMPNAQVKIKLSESAHLNNHGKDDIDLLFSANKGIDPVSIHKSASGGEISRFNLAIKSIVAKKLRLPTMILDEIDTGVSGDVSLKMGKLLNKISDDQQIITITHSPQIAARGRRHLHVYKHDNQDRTFTRVKELSQPERIHEIAVMLSAQPPSEAAIQNAEELLKTTT